MVQHRRTSAVRTLWWSLIVAVAVAAGLTAYDWDGWNKHAPQSTRGANLPVTYTTQWLVS